MNISTAEQFLLDQIPPRVQRLIVPRLKLAYAAAEEHIKATPMLQIPTAADDKGRIITWAVDYSIKGLIDSGEWKADYSWQPYARPTGCYLEIRLPHSTLSISQVKFSQEQPRNVVFRENARLGNSQISFPGFGGEEEDDAVAGRPSFLLVHGHKTLEFAHIGIPHKHHEHGYIYQTTNLMKMPYDVPASELVPAEPKRNVDELLTLKAEIEKWQQDNEGQ
jgi:hypothetical protein